MKHVYTSIDIGSDTVKVVVCELFNNKLNLLAASSVKSRGIKKGLITDGHEASISLKKALTDVEDMLGIKIKKVLATIPNYFSEFVIVKGKIDLNNEEEITGEDISNVFKVAMDSKDKGNKEVVTVIPIDFSVDDKAGIKDPKGLKGNYLATRAVMVLTPRKNILSVTSLLENCGLEVVDISLNSIGDIYSIRDKDIKDKVGAVINIGHETTSISLYNKGIIVNNSMIGVGGKNINNDISYIYKLKHNDAAKIKEKFALAHKKYASKNDSYDITNKLEEDIKINQFEVSEVVMARIEEILVLARKEINVLTKRDVDYILITGGTSSMNNFKIIAEEVLGDITRIGDIRLIGLRNNKYSAAVGNIVYYINKMKLKGKILSLINEEEIEQLSSNKKSLINVSDESMLGKVFGYFFSE